MNVSSCQCEKCQSACDHVPGSPTPAEAEAMLDAGLADRLMLDAFPRDVLDIKRSPDLFRGDSPSLPVVLLLPRVVNGSSVGERFWCMVGSADSRQRNLDRMNARLTVGRCTFFRDGCCEIHDSGFKPEECRYALPCSADTMSRAEMWAAHIMIELDMTTRLDLWEEEHGRAVVRRWKSEMMGRMRA